MDATERHAARTSRLDRLLAEYMDRVDRGEDVDRAAMIEAHPDLAQELRSFFDGDDAVAALGGAAAADPDAPHRPRAFGDYELLDRIARGGMGVVYRARQRSLNRVVALKMILAGNLATPAEVRRFRVEAEAAATLDHPNVVPIHEIGEHDGQHYFTMRLVEGGSLDRHADRLRGDFAEAARLAAAIAEAVDHAHRRGILHRDLKPSNILLDERGEPQITDFGLARRVDSAASQTLRWSVAGTPSYMAPEQADGRASAATTAVDVYGLGAILYELLTGRPPFRGASAYETIRMVLDDPPVRPRSLDRRVPRDLETICLKCLEKDPARRYASALEVAEELRRWIGREPIRARPARAPERLAKWSRRNPAAAALAVVVVLSAASVAAAVLHGWAESLRGLRRERQNSYYQRIALAERAWASNDVGRARELLGGCDEEFRDWEWHYLSRLCRPERLTIRAFPDETHDPKPAAVAFAPGGGLLAAPSGPGRVGIWDASTGERVRTLRGQGLGAAHAVAFSPDGRLVAAMGDGPAVHLWEVETGRRLRTFRLPRPGDQPGAEGETGPAAGSPLRSKSIYRAMNLGGALSFRPDGVALAAAVRGGAVAFEVETGRVLRRYRGLPAKAWALAYRPDGRRLAAAGEADVVRVWDEATARPLLDLPGPADIVRALAYHPDGSRLAAAGEDGLIQVWDDSTGAEVLAIRDPGERFFAVGFSPDGCRLAAAGRSWTVRAWDASDGSPLLTLRGHGKEVVGLAFDPAGSRLASAGLDGTVRLWDASAVSEWRELEGHAGPVQAVAFRRDGALVATGGRDGTVRLWEAATGRLALEAAGVGPVGCLVFAPGGSTLAAGRADGRVELLDAATGRVRREYVGHAGPVLGLAFDAPGRRLATAGADGAVLVHEVATSRVLARLEPGALPARSVAFDESGRRLAVAEGDLASIATPGAVRVHDAETGRRLLEARDHEGGAFWVGFEPGGTALASAGWDRTVRLRDAADGRPIRTLRGQDVVLFAASWSPDGRRLVTADNIGRLRFWDPANGEEVLTLRGHPDRITSVAFSPDGRFLATAGRDESARVFDARPLGP